MDSFKRVVDTCARCLSRHEMAASEGPVMLAVSGGVDSTVLLLVMVQLQAEGRLSGPLVAAHIDHSVRPDSWQNAQHVVEMCDRLDVPLAVRKLHFDKDCPSEESMRDKRYHALGEAAKQFGSTLLVTGHHADDNLETVLFRMLRGTGPRGLAGIPESRWLDRGNRQLMLVRPLLRTRRKMIENLLEQSGEQAFHDSSNDDMRFTRNALRHETMPALRETMGIGLDVALITVSTSAREANNLIEAQGLRILSHCTRLRNNWRLEIDTREIDEDSLPFLREALRQGHVNMHSKGWSPSTAWLDRCMSLLDKDDGKRVAGRSGLMVERTRNGLLLIDTDRAAAPPVGTDTPQHLYCDGSRQRFGETEWSLEVHEHPLPPMLPSPSEAGPFRALIDPKSCGGKLYLRKRQAGDRFQPLGSRESMDLRRFLQSRHLPRFDRDRLPLVVNQDDRILWIPGVEISELARLQLNTRQCLEIITTCS